MEAAIAWLVQTILATLLIEKLDAWIRRVGLADDVEKLKSEIRRVGMVVSALKGRSIGNEPLAQSLARLKELLYEADDVVDELDYYRLQQQVQGVIMDEPQGMRGAERVDDISSSDVDTPMNSSVGKLRSVVWEHFMITEKYDGRPIKAKCTYCTEEFKCQTKTNGTSSMKKHLENAHSVTCTKKPPGVPHQPNPSSAGEPIAIDSSSGTKGKKRRSKAWGLVDIVEEENGQYIKARCKYCPTQINCGGNNGTGSILNHHKICKKKPGPNDKPSNPSSIAGASASATPTVVGDSSSRKRRRAIEDSTQITAANTHTPWDETIYSNMIQTITSQLQHGRGEVSEVLKLHGSDFASSSNHHHSTGLDQHLRTSSFVPREVYGRVAEKNSIIKMITEDKSDCVAVLPIVGIAGVGKTVLAQVIYNDLDVKKLFHHRVWIWVSRNFDEVRLMREMLDFIPQERTDVHEERHERISSFAKLQEILASRANSKRLLFILDDVWDDMTVGRWENLLKPIKFGCANGSVILVTTRDTSVAKMAGTTEQIKLGALEHDEFWLLFKLHAFGDENYKGDQILSDIGQKIAEKLKGNPLAAESTGKILKEKLNTDHWNNILKNEDWKSLQLSGGIMHALKLSYDQLPYSLQKCFSCCSIFPERYQFHGGELAHIWISHGFVKDSYSSKEIEQNYLIQLVNLGFFQQVEREESSPGSETFYVVCGLMHDFARMVSLTECGTIDGLHCNKMSPTIRHLSIVTDSEYRKYEHRKIPRNEKFEKNLRDTVTSVSKLRTLVLLGHYDSFFLQLFQDIFGKAHNLRLLQMSARSADFPKCGYDKVDGALPRVLSKLYHLRVLNVGSYTDPAIPDGINNLVSLQHFVVHKGVHSSIGSGFEMTQLQSTDESLEHWVHVKPLEEAYEAVLRNNEHSENLILSCKETSADIGMDLQCLEPCSDVKDLQISGYDDNVWFSRPESNISTSFQAVHIDDCAEWKILLSFRTFPFLTKLKLSDLEEVKEILVPSLEELVLVEMPKLERCSCTSVEGLNSRLRALQIEECKALKEFDLFENDDKFEIEQKPWLPGIRKLILRGCPHLKVLNPLPPSTTCSELLIAGVSVLPSMEGASSENLYIGYSDEFMDDDIDEYCDDLRVLDDKILEFHNLRNLKSMSIRGCRNLSYISFKGFSHLVSLQELEICRCEQLFSSDVMPEHTLEDLTAASGTAFPSLKILRFTSCVIAGKWLYLLLRHTPDLEELHLDRILSIEEGDSSSGEQDDELTGLTQDGLVHVPLNLISSLKKISTWGCPRLIFTSLEKLNMWECPNLFSSLVHKDGNDVWANGRWLLPTSIEELYICSNYSIEKLQLCFPTDITNLKEIKLWGYHGLESLELHYCMALEELAIEECESLTTIEGLQYLCRLRHLTIQRCESLIALEGLQSLVSLRHLEVCNCPGLRPYLESFFSRQGYELCSRLETLHISDPSVFTTSSCVGFTSLQRLQLQCLVLTEEQGRALGLLTSLQELAFHGSYYADRIYLPAGLQLLPSLKRLEIWACGSISRLSETGFPVSLEQLEINNCSIEVENHCWLLATNKLRVKIDGEWYVL